MPEIKSGVYSDFSTDEIESFKELVLSESRVRADTLPDLLRAAKKLLILLNGNTVIGTAAIKIPNKGRPESIFKKAKIEFPQGVYEFELGWVVVHPDHRGQKYSKMLVDAALCYIEKAVYATSRETDVPMHKSLENCGFYRAGAPYTSDSDKRLDVLLFLRPA